MQLDYYYEQQYKKIDFKDRKLSINDKNTIIYGAPRSGKSYLLLNYLSNLKKDEYLYIDCTDIRLDINLLNLNLQKFIDNKNITTILLDNYITDIKLPDCDSIILTTNKPLAIKGFITLRLTTLDFEEFLSFESKIDSIDTIFARYLKNGSFPEINKTTGNIELYIQNILLLHLENKELKVFKLLTQYNHQKVSVNQIYQKLKIKIKISKDILYKIYDDLYKKQLFYLLEKFEHPKAAKKIYMFDFTIKNVLTYNKDFNALFANLIYLELNRNYQQIFYADGIDFFIPSKNTIVLSIPFSSLQLIEKRIDKLRYFTATHYVKKIYIITMNYTKDLSYLHPFCEAIPFIDWSIAE